MVMRAGWLSVGAVTLATSCFDPTQADDKNPAGSSSSTQTGVTGGPESDDSGPASSDEAGTMTTEAGPGSESSVDTSSSGVGESTTESSPTGSSTTDTGGIASCNTFDRECDPTMKCNPYADDDGAVWNALGCFPLDPAPVGVGAPCTVEGHPASGIDDCEAGSMCWDVDPDTLEGVCRPFCTGSEGDPICGDPSTACATGYDGVVHLCLATCDPLLQDCIDEYVCAPLGDEFVCAFDVSGNGGGYGSECDAFNSCNPGLFCTDPPQVPGCSNAAAGCCTEFCDNTDPGASMSCAGSASGQECFEWFDFGQAPPGYQHVGYCGL